MFETDIKKIEELVQIIEKSSLFEFSIKEDDFEITMSRRGEVQAGAPLTTNVTAAAHHVVETEEEELYITSPIIGTFYSSPSPEEKAFVNPGDVIRTGQTVAIIEAMKMMNEIESEYDCEIEAVLVSNEQKVEYGQPLFRIRRI